MHFNFSDFSLIDEELGMDKNAFQYLQFPGSFRASLGQLSDETYWAFRNASNGMNEIALTMPHVKSLLIDAMKFLYQVRCALLQMFFQRSLHLISNSLDLKREKNMASF